MYSNVKKEKEYKSSIAHYIVLGIIFNPLAVVSPAIHNLQIPNHFLLILAVYMVLTQGYGIMTDSICASAIYGDPNMLYVLIPLRVIHSTLSSGRALSLETFKSFLTWGIILAGLIFASGDWQAELRNYQNIVFVKDHSENIGVFWYIFVEVSFLCNSHCVLRSLSSMLPFISTSTHFSFQPSSSC